MAVILQCGCGKDYVLPDSWAGKTSSCHWCGAELEFGEAVPDIAVPGQAPEHAAESGEIPPEPEPEEPEEPEIAIDLPETDGEPEIVWDDAAPAETAQVETVELVPADAVLSKTARAATSGINLQKDAGDAPSPADDEGIIPFVDSAPEEAADGPEPEEYIDLPSVAGDLPLDEPLEFSPEMSAAPETPAPPPARADAADEEPLEFEP